ncbi:MAG: hypothetical protein R2822_07235 [Spirosomataceae bacterium]
MLTSILELSLVAVILVWLIALTENNKQQAIIEDKIRMFSGLLLNWNTSKITS